MGHSSPLIPPPCFPRGSYRLSGTSSPRLPCVEGIGEDGVRSSGCQASNVLLLAAPTPSWQAQALDRTLFFTLGSVCRGPWVSVDRWGQVHAR